MVLCSFRKEKSTSLDSWFVKLFVGFYEDIVEDLMRVIEESRVNKRMLNSFNATFIALIPKLRNPSYFEGFKYIYLCNCI